MIDEHLPILVTLTFLLGALLMPPAGLIHRRMPWVVAVSASLLATLFAVRTLVEVAASGTIRYAVGDWMPPIGIELVADPFSAFMNVVLGFIAVVVLLHSREPVEHETNGGTTTYYAVALLMLGGFSGIVGTGDLFNLYVFLEISALASYALLGAGSPRAAASAFRYLISGTIGASFFLIGLGFVFIETGSLNMADISAIVDITGPSFPVTLGIIFMVVGVGVKTAIIPLHQWLPDAYTSAPATSSALIAPIGTKIGAYVMIRLLVYVFPTDSVSVGLIREVVGALGAIGIIWGSVMAIPQKNLKRMLAYSSISQVGYIALGIGLGTTFGLIGAVLHILNHACMKGCLFLVSANFEFRGKGVAIEELDATARRDMPISSACFVVGAISMVGLPPTAGFFSKWYLLAGSHDESRWIYITVILVSSLLNAVYFFRIIERMYLGGGDASSSTTGQRETVLLAAPAGVLALALLILGFGNALIVTEFIAPMFLPAG